MNASFKLCLLCHLCILCAAEVQITEQPQNNTWDVNSSNKKIWCTVKSNNVKNIEWLKHGALISTAGPRRSVQERRQNDSVLSELQFMRILETDKGTYQCRVALTGPSSYLYSSEAQILVSGPPFVTQGPSSLSAKLYTSSLGMSCVASGVPPIKTVFWKYVMYANLKAVYSNVYNTSYINGILNQLPNIYEAVKSNVTSYSLSCKVKNAKGTSASSHQARVTLLRQAPKPIINSIIANVTEATVIWDPMSRDVSLCTIKVEANGAEQSYTVEIPITTQILPNLHWNTPYNVSVKCRNSLYSSQWSELKSFTTKEGVPLLSPKNIHFIFGEQNVTASWFPISKDSVPGKLLGYQFQLLKNMTVIDNSTVVKSSITLNKLDSRQMYQFQVCGYTAAGNGMYSPLKSFKAPFYEVPPAPVITNISSLEDPVQVKFDDIGNGSHPVTSCTAKIVDLNHPEFIISRNLSPGSVLAVSLVSNTYYTISMFCTNKVGDSLPSERVTFVTGKKHIAPVTAPCNVSATQVGNSTLNVTWTLQLSENEIVDYFYISVKPPGSAQPSYYRQPAHAGQYFKVIDGIEPGTTYTVMVASGNLAGTGVFSQPPVYIVTWGDLVVSTPSLNETITGNQVKQSFSSTVVYVFVILAASLVTGVVAVLFVIRKRRKERRSHEIPTSLRRLPDAQNANTLNAYMDMSPQRNSTVFQLEEKLGNALIDKQSLELGKVLGEGEFGYVYKAKLKITEEGSQGIPLDVAVKTIKLEDCTFAEKEAFINEGLRMRDLSHPNVMHLVGICLSNPGESAASSYSFSPLVVLSFMENGDLHSYLFRIRSSGQVKNFTLLKLLLFGLDIAKGMKYLASKNFIHRDLAARNCMIDEKFNVLVSDFGLSKQMYSENYYRQTNIKKMPVKWMAIESLADNIYTSMTDVWSFGVTMWEILTFCQVPYPGVSNNEMYQLLRHGTRLTKPPTCSSEVWCKIVMPCWIAQTSARITFAKLVDKLNILTKYPPEDCQEPLDMNVRVISTDLYDEVVEMGTTSYDMAADDPATAKFESSPLLAGNSGSNSSIVNL